MGDEFAAAARALPAGRTPRAGRPPNAVAGEVEQRILDAATAAFLSRGYEGASFEQIAALAQAGKATIYARHAGKEALFTAVVRRGVDASLGVADGVADAVPAADRLRQTAFALLSQMLTVESVSFMRLVIAEGPRFPELARHADDIGRQRAIDIVWRALLAERGGAVARAAANVFLDQLFAPLMIRALLGEPLAALRQEITGHVHDAIARLPPNL